MSDSNPPEPPQDRPLTFFTGGVWTLIALMLMQLAVGVTEEGRAGASTDLVSTTGCMALAYSIVFFGILRLHEPQASIRHVLGLRAPAPLALILGLALGAALALPSDWLDNFLESRFPTAPEDEEVVKSALAVTSVGKAIGLFVTLALIRPIVTELFFRGALFTPLRRTRGAQAVIFAVAAFETLGNLFSPRYALVFLVSTLVFSWVRGVTGSVIPSMMAHIAFYAVGVVPMVLRKPELQPTKMLLLASSITALVSLIGLSLISRSARAIDARQRDAGEVPL